MKKIAICLTSAITLMVFSALTYAQHHDATMQEKPARLVPGLGNLHHPVTTNNTQAQRFFDQGLILIYAFDHDQARRSFERAAQLDPKLAMAYWGIALALGPNYNLDVDPDREKAAYDASQKAVALSAGVSAHDKAYISALAQRFTNESNPYYSKLAVAYKDAMKAVAARYPNDPDAGTLYAESLMDLRPWKLWSNDGVPAEGTLEIVSVLQGVLKKFPNHIGANHFYIHALEASPHPGQALVSARRLETLSPAAGHLVHMPSHTFIRTGDYHAAVLSNEQGVAADRAAVEHGDAGAMYSVMYYGHNFHFLAAAACWEGNYSAASKAADGLSRNLQERGAGMDEMTDWFHPIGQIVLVRFRRWNDVLKLAVPGPSFPITHAMYHFSRGMAFASTGETQKATEELQALTAEEKKLAAESMWGFNSSHTTLGIGEAVLQSKISASSGNLKTAIEVLKPAAETEDNLSYDEPPDWLLPVRETLGGLLLQNKQYKEATEVFRTDLAHHPKSGRSLFGLSLALKGEGKIAESRRVHAQFVAAWAHSDTKLRLEDL